MQDKHRIVTQRQKLESIVVPKACYTYGNLIILQCSFFTEAFSIANVQVR